MIEQIPIPKQSLKDIVYITRSNSELTEDDFRRFKRFVTFSYKEAIPPNMTLTPENKEILQERQGSFMNHAFALDFLESHHPARSESIIFAQLREDMIGYSIIAFRENSQISQVGLSFLGVREDFHNLGIGTELLRRRIKELSNLGIREYTVPIRTQVLRLYGKLNFDYSFSEGPTKKVVLITVRW